jgi:hypothetical protein
MPSSGMLRLVALVRNDVSEERIALNRFTLLRNNVSSQSASVLFTANVGPSSQIFVSLMMEDLRSSETSILTRTTRRNITEEGILHSHHPKNLKSYRDKSSFQNLVFYI